MEKETFDFSEALRRMKEGKKVKRLNWNPNYFLYIDKEIIYLHYYEFSSIFSNEFVSEGNIMFVCTPNVNDDILAINWEEYNE